jgi:lipopolysaccharide/colanic/teichoic acid biosynthesis glycosyltransferase
MSQHHLGWPFAWHTRLQVLASWLIIGSLTVALTLSNPWSPESRYIITYTALGCIIAAFVGILLIRNFGNYPGVEQFFYIIPAFCASYGALLAFLVFARFPYSRSLITSSFVGSIFVFAAVHALLRRRMKLRIGVVTEGDYRPLLQVPGVEWRMLSAPGVVLDDLDAVSVDLWCDLSDEWERELASLALRGIPVYHSKHLYESLTGKVEIERLSENNFGTLSPLRTYMNVKMAIDWVLALVALAVLLPILSIIAVIVRFDSPGPVIFRQTRVGYRGKHFLIYKIRTMTVATNHGGYAGQRHAAMTQNNDQRVTRIGRFLRHSRLDELPQLINVLRGEMSWIGPRPEAEVLSRWYENEISFYRYRHIVRPGITGWAQVHQGHVADVDEVREKLNFDFYYIKNFSLWVDVIVVARTIKTILTGFGSR